jgi:hypothetical protein
MRDLLDRGATTELETHAGTGLVRRSQAEIAERTSLQSSRPRLLPVHSLRLSLSFAVFHRGVRFLRQRRYVSCTSSSNDGHEGLIANRVDFALSWCVLPFISARRPLFAESLTRSSPYVLYSSVGITAA